MNIFAICDNLEILFKLARMKKMWLRIKSMREHIPLNDNYKTFKFKPMLINISYNGYITEKKNRFD